MGKVHMIDELCEAFDLAAQQSEQAQAAIAARIKQMIEAVRQPSLRA